MPDRLSDKQMRQLMSYAVTDARAIAKNALELQDRAQRVADELTSRIDATTIGSDSAMGDDDATTAIPGPAPSLHPLTAAIKFDDGSTLAFDAGVQSVGSLNCYSTFIARKGSWACVYHWNGARGDACFEYGAIVHDDAQAKRSQGYVATLTKGGVEVVKKRAPYHDWGARWRLQTEVIVPIDNRADWIAKKLIPSFDPAIVLGRDESEQSWVKPFDKAGIDSNMAGTGERSDIGAFSEWEGEFFASGSAADLRTCIAQAEAHGGFANHFRQGDAWLDLSAGDNKYLTSHENERGKESYIAPGSPRTFTLDSAHYPSVCYAAWLMTGDPYYVEELQAAVVGNLLETNYWRGSGNGLVIADQPRCLAWVARNALWAYNATPDGAPAWLLPRSFFRQCLKDVNDFTIKRSDPEGNTLARFNVARADMSASVGIQFWQQEFIASVLGLAVYCGVEAVRPAWEWTLQGTIDRLGGLQLANGTKIVSGWPWQHSCPYNLNDNSARKILGNSEKSWAELWAAYAGAQGIAANPTYDDWRGDKFYLMYQIGSLAVAILNGKTQLRPLYDKLAQYRTVSEAKWAFKV